MLKFCAGMRAAHGLTSRLFSAAATAATGTYAASAGTAATSGISPAPRPAYQTHEVPVYSLPYYGADETEIVTLDDADVDRVLKAYGGLLRKKDAEGARRERLALITRDRLTISGVVVSDRMDKSVVVAARRRAYSDKMRKEYAVTRRFMAHDELNLCREGDRVTIRSCRPMSRWKNHVVVRNYGDHSRIGEDKRAAVLERAVESTLPCPPLSAVLAADA
jgi:small subunit ribosomal protein S17